MYIYNITINIDETLHKAWLKWIRLHIQKVLNTGCFTSAKMTQVLVEEEMGGVTYAIQYTAKTRENLNNYYKNDIIIEKEMEQFSDKIVVFRTELKLIEDFVPNKN